MPCFSILTLGCKVNQYESEAIAEAFERLGWERHSSLGVNDVVITIRLGISASAVKTITRFTGAVHSAGASSAGVVALLMTSSISGMDGIVPVFPGGAAAEQTAYPLVSMIRIKSSCKDFLCIYTQLFTTAASDS